MLNFPSDFDMILKAVEKKWLIDVHIHFQNLDFDLMQPVV